MPHHLYGVEEGYSEHLIGNAQSSIVLSTASLVSKALYANYVSQPASLGRMMPFKISPNPRGQLFCLMIKEL